MNLSPERNHPLQISLRAAVLPSKGGELEARCSSLFSLSQRCICIKIPTLSCLSHGEQLLLPPTGVIERGNSPHHDNYFPVMEMGTVGQYTCNKDCNAWRRRHFWLLSDCFSPYTPQRLGLSVMLCHCRQLVHSRHCLCCCKLLSCFKIFIIKYETAAQDNTNPTGCWFFFVFFFFSEHQRGSIGLIYNSWPTGVLGSLLVTLTCIAALLLYTSVFVISWYVLSD